MRFVWLMLAAPSVIVMSGIAMFPLFRAPAEFRYKGRHRS